jgi:hypothetical protein
MALLLVAGCTTTAKKKKRTVTRHVVVEVCRVRQPCVDPPPQYRFRNPDGSCVHVAFATVLANQGQDEMARWWVQRYHGGEGSNGLRSKAQAAGIKYSDTTLGDVAWLDWAMRTGRGAIVNDRPGHVRTLVGLDPAGPDAKAYVLDNHGNPLNVISYDRDKWITMWHRRGGWAATAVYNPDPPTVW